MELVLQPTPITCMNEQVKEYIDKYPDAVIDMFNTLRQMIFDSVSCKPEEILWAKIPSYYVGEAFVRLIPFKDHINIEAQSVIQHKEELAGYKINMVFKWNKSHKSFTNIIAWYFCPQYFLRFT